MRYASLLVAIVLGACSRPLDLPAEQGTDCASITDSTACATNPACGIGGCPYCVGDKLVYPCVDRAHAALGLLCEGTPVCTMPACESASDESTCDEISGCYATFINGSFTACKAGSPACLSGTFGCATAKPEPVCDDGFVPDYGANGCVVDCVRQSACPKGT